MLFIATLGSQKGEQSGHTWQLQSINWHHGLDPSVRYWKFWKNGDERAGFDVSAGYVVAEARPIPIPSLIASSNNNMSLLESRGRTVTVVTPAFPRKGQLVPEG